MMEWIDEEDNPEKSSYGHYQEQRTIPVSVAPPAETKCCKQRATKNGAETNEMLRIVNQEMNLIAQAAEEYVQLATNRQTEEGPDNDVQDEQNHQR